MATTPQPSQSALDDLAELDDGSFRQRLNRELLSPRATPATHALYEHDDVIERTFDALEHLSREVTRDIERVDAAAKSADKRGDTRAFASAKADREPLIAERDAINVQRAMVKDKLRRLQQAQLRGARSFEDRALEMLFRENPNLRRKLADVRRRLHRIEAEQEAAVERDVPSEPETAPRGS